MKIEPVINIQDEVAKIHAQYGMSEMANYQIEKLFEKYVKQFSPKIKQLEWSEERSPDNNISYNHVKANSPLGMYTIQWKGWKEYDDRTICLDGDFVSMGGDFLDDAKILAQEDFEARVKKCLIIE